jgi:asparagine synthase (glutamine-hydrolysing)
VGDACKEGRRAGVADPDVPILRPPVWKRGRLMCGIFGVFGAGASRVSNDAASAAIESLRRRGPDGRGLWRDEGGGGLLGHTRLSVIDLSTTGSQPMQSADGRFVVTYNGEIYNYAELRSELLAGGASFRGTSDTEVLLAAFDAWGVDAVHRFVGMFAFALLDRKENVLRLYRDRLGVKPLYYATGPFGVAFASELKALRAAGIPCGGVDPGALSEFFRFGFIGAPRSIYERVRKVRPGHYLEVRDGKLAERRYWSLKEAEREGPFPGTEREVEERLEALLRSAFRYRMVADVPVGVFLSGGVDSSLLAALLQSENVGRIRTFTVGFAERSYDESTWAAHVARHLGTEHTERICTQRDAVDLLRAFPDIYDEPFGDTSGIPTALLARMAREHVKVALSADGGDELFCGYSYYIRQYRIGKALFASPAWARSGLSRGCSAIPPSALRLATSIIPSLPREGIEDKARKFRALLACRSWKSFYETSMSYWLPAEIDALLGRDSRDEVEGEDSGVPADHPIEGMMRWGIRRYLPGDVLTKVDRATMYAGLEAREPFLDHRLVEFSARVPFSLKLRGTTTKFLLRRILYRHVPRELVDRPKMGFGIPVETWLRGEIAVLAREYLDPARVRREGVLDPKIVAEVAGGFLAGRALNPTRLMLLLIFQMWKERWLP